MRIGKATDNRRPGITCAIQTRNREAEVQFCIQSVLAQTLKPYEILVVIDASQDNTEKIIRKNFTEVRIKSLTERVGCDSGRNVIFNEVRTEYVMIIDDDGWLEPNALAIAKQMLDENPRVAVVSLSLCDPPSRQIYPFPFTEKLYYAYTFGSGSCAVRMEAIDEVRGYPTDFWEGGEFDVAIRLLDSGYEIVKMRDAIMWHNVSRLRHRPYRLKRLYAINIARMAVKYFPLPFAVGKVCREMQKFVLWSFKRRHLNSIISDLYFILEGCFKSIGQRKPVKIGTYRKYRSLAKQEKVIAKRNQS